MTKFIEQRVEVLEKEVAELKLIVHELRGKKSIEPSATNTVGYIIEFEGKQYRKVVREAREEDYVSVSFKEGKCFKPNKIYGPVFKEGNDLYVNADSSTSRRDYEEALVYNSMYGRSPETVEVYELIAEDNSFDSVDYPLDEEKSPNLQRAAIIEKAKKFVEENVANGRTSNHITEKGNSTYRDNYYDVDFFVKEGKVTAVVYWLVCNKRRIDKPSNVGRAICTLNDVFNEHIGKAIALGRALGLDVSEFEQAVQPNEVVVGQIVSALKEFYLTETGVIGEVTSVRLDGCPNFNNGWASHYRIINDTNAIYGGVE